ncbi:MAG: beta-galactosidase [Phycisphaerae bacterium]|nr:beta-galactosidase [Phycisphaerae bacterium]
MLSIAFTCAVAIGMLPTAPEDVYRIAILAEALPEHDPGLADELTAALQASGHAVQPISAAELSAPAALNIDTCDCVILPSSSVLPAECIPAIEQFLQHGGDILALGAPAFTRPVARVGDEWFGVESYQQRLAGVAPDRMLFDFESGDVSGWHHATRAPASPTVAECLPGPHGQAMHVRIENMTSWDTWQSPPVADAFGAGHELTCFFARGVGATTSLMVEWTEKDGSRWIATVPLTKRWKHYVLEPSAFLFWESVPGRGGPGDRFNPANAAHLTVGVAQTHTGLRAGAYEFFIDEIGTAANPLADVPLVLRGSPPVIEGLSPDYKFYRCNDVAALRVRSPWLANVAALPMASTIFAHHPRPTGKGFNKGRAWRWIPLLEAIGPAGEWRGAAAAMYVDFDGPTKGSVRTAVGVTDSGWYREPAVQRFLVAVVDRMARGVFFREAGTDFFTYRPGEPVRLGAAVANLSRGERAGLDCVCAWTAGDTAQQQAMFRDVSLSAGDAREATSPLAPPAAGETRVLSVRLMAGDRVLDEITHELAVYAPKPPEQRTFMTVRDGDFILDGRKWYAHGVNYMPSTGIAIEDYPYFERWIGARPYDPEFIQRDLERCRAMGLNTVSIFIYAQSAEANNLLDILRRCENLGLLVNLSIRPGTPMEYEWADWQRIIEHARLWEFDVIYAYDIAWEPFFGHEPERRRYDSQWREWIDAKYGSADAAEQAWGVPAPRHDGQVTTPANEQLGNDGPHRKIVVDYRRFVDELVHSRYQAAADQIRTLDPNHLISFRMTVTGDPTCAQAPRLPYDFRGVARAMDFMAPEGYGRIGSWERIKPGLFTVAYARCCAPDKPVLWAEAGTSVWSRLLAAADPAALEFQGDYFADFYRMVLESSSNGVVWWWYPGGFRTNENSDFGIINPDGTDRPATATIRRFAPRVLAERTIPTPDVWIDIDRDADARGILGVYEHVKERYWQAIEAGKRPGLRDRTAP